MSHFVHLVFARHIYSLVENLAKILLQVYHSPVQQ